MTDGNVTRVFSPDEALAFVIERGVITMPIAELAAAWGCPHCTQVYQALDRWARAGLIERQGKVIRARAEENHSTSQPRVTTELMSIPALLPHWRPS
jgi:hypothetical protein